MNLTLRMPQPDDYAAIATWVSDANACIRWAGPLVPFPFAVAELQQLLTVSNGESYCLVAPGTSPFGFGQHFIVESNGVSSNINTFSPRCDVGMLELTPIC